MILVVLLVNTALYGACVGQPTAAIRLLESQTPIAAYLDGDISLGQAAELLEIQRFDLLARFNRLGLPARLGPLSLNEARAEYGALQGVDEV